MTRDEPILNVRIFLDKTLSCVTTLKNYEGTIDWVREGSAHNERSVLHEGFGDSDVTWSKGIAAFQYIVDIRVAENVL